MRMKNRGFSELAKWALIDFLNASWIVQLGACVMLGLLITITVLGARTVLASRASIAAHDLYLDHLLSETNDLMRHQQKLMNQKAVLQVKLQQREAELLTLTQRIDSLNKQRNHEREILRTFQKRRQHLDTVVYRLTSDSLQRAFTKRYPL